jgi:hypothetical protein
MPTTAATPKRPPSDENAAAPSGANKAGPNKERQAMMKRRSYIQLRLAEVGERVKALAAERETLTKTLAGRQGEKSPEVKQLRDKRGYASTRLEMLRAEQKELTKERKTIHQKVTETAKKK